MLSRGLPQGSASAPELSKAAQDPILRLRECSPAAYVTRAGTRVAAAGFDVEHYGRGAADIRPILLELSLGSQGTGIGFSWEKGSAFASDWDGFIRGGFRVDMSDLAVQASGWDIWNGGRSTASLPRALELTEETLLGKPGSVADRHTAAAQASMEMLAALRRAIQRRGCSWDEVAAMYQLRMRGFLSYSPLLGIPSSALLHAEDQALARLLLARLGTRNTAEHASLWAAHTHGGLQIPGVVESLAAAVAADLLPLLSGDSVASRIAREQLHASMNLEPPEAAADMGLLTRAMRFLATVRPLCHGFHRPGGGPYLGLHGTAEQFVPAASVGPVPRG